MNLKKFFNPKKIQAEIKEEGYYQVAKDWYHERYEIAFVSLRRYRFISFGLSVLLALSLFAFVSLLPLKKSYYRLIEVNQQTGEVTQLKEVDSSAFNTNWIVTRYFLHQYVLNRHLYHHEDIKRTFNIALAMSDKKIADEYAQMIIDTNPNSPLNVLNKTSYRDVNILGINQLNAKTALVRFQTITKNVNIINENKTEDFQAVIKWNYKNNEITNLERDLNPLNFRVIYYQVSPVFTEKA